MADTWLTSRLSHRPSKLAYHILDIGFRIKATLKLETFLTAPSNIQHSDLAEMSYCDETYQMKGKKET